MYFGSTYISILQTLEPLTIGLNISAGQMTRMTKLRSIIIICAASSIEHIMLNIEFDAMMHNQLKLNIDCQLMMHSDPFCTCDEVVDERLLLDKLPFQFVHCAWPIHDVSDTHQIRWYPIRSVG